MGYLCVTVGNVFVGANVVQRAQLGENYLENIEVVAVRGSKNIGLVARILHDHGATVREFDHQIHSDSAIASSISLADIFLDGVQKGGKLEEAASNNHRLIVAQCDCDDPFSAMSAVARISMALAKREISNHGQRLIASDELNYWKKLNRYERNSK
ncbi:unnamed protein product [Caenorhabditis bovis]|uniref:Uncharacterized protein n=1 Tax=Caenorhabditis bovis TaxID=2654633 RepID=A0A8S1EW22_9PELO|nr:unnamed protein product [Caenorhabditis bovis]